MRVGRADNKYLLKVDEKGRITIPLSARELIGIEPGMFVELLVDSSTKTMVVKPLTTGVIASYRLRLRERKDIVDVISTILEEGSELRYVECGEVECVAGVLVIDTVMVEKLAEKLQVRGVSVIEYTTK